MQQFKSTITLFIFALSVIFAGQKVYSQNTTGVPTSLKNWKFGWWDTHKMNKAAKLRTEATDLMTESSKLNTEINALHFISDTTSNKKLKDKSKNNCDKLEAKQLSLQFKSVENTGEANELTNEIYSKTLVTVRKNSKTNLDSAQYLEKDAGTLFAKAKTMKKALGGVESGTSLLNWKEANDLEKMGLQNQERAYLLYNNLIVKKTEDKKIVVDTTKKNPVVIPPVKTETIKEILTDRERQILPKINVDNDGMKRFYIANNNNLKSDSSMVFINQLSKKVTDLNNSLATTEPSQVNDIKFKIDGFNDQLAKNYIPVLKSYIDGNHTKLRIYNNQLRAANSNATIYSKQADKYATFSSTDFDKSLTLRADADKQGNSTQILAKLKESHLYSLSALNKIENAYAGYLNLSFFEPLNETASNFKAIEETKINPVTDNNNNVNSSKTKEDDSKYSSDVLLNEINKSLTNKPKKESSLDTSLRKFPYTFLINLGEHKTLPKKFFGNYTLKAKKLEKKNLSGYTFGNFKTLEGAEFAAEELKRRGYTIVKVESFNNTKRIDNEEVKKILKNGNKELYKKYNEEARKEVEQIKREIKTSGLKILNPNVDKKFVKVYDIKSVSGKFYTILLGTFKTPRTPANMHNQSPIYGEKLANSSIKYCFGIYDSEEKATEEKTKLENIGFNDPEIISYDNVEKYENTEKSVTKYIEIKDDENVYVKPIDISKIKEQFYSVQLGIFKNPVKPEDIFTEKSIYGLKEKGGAIKYTCGKYDNFDDAQKERNRLVKVGFKNPFVVAFENGKQIEIDDAKEPPVKTITKKNDKKKTIDQIVYRVQIAALTEDLSVEKLKKDRKVSDDFEVEKFTDSREMYIYAIGDCKNKTEADKIRQSLKKKGVDGFVIATKGKKKVKENNE